MVLGLLCLELCCLHNPDSAAQHRFYFLAWWNATRYTNPQWGWVNVMVLSDKCISVEGAAQKLVGEVSGVVRPVRLQNKLTSTRLLQMCSRW